MTSNLFSMYQFRLTFNFMVLMVPIFLFFIYIVLKIKSSNNITGYSTYLNMLFTTFLIIVNSLVNSLVSSYSTLQSSFHFQRIKLYDLLTVYNCDRIFGLLDETVGYLSGKIWKAVPLCFSWCL